MTFDPQAGITDSTDNRVANRRQAGRLPLEGVTCRLGDVINLSSGGMQVISRKLPQGAFMVRLVSNCELAPIEVKARVAWAAPAGFIRRRYGLEFLDVDEETSAALTKMAITHRPRRAM